MRFPCRIALWLLCVAYGGMGRAQVTFVPNEGQWNAAVDFQADIQSGRVFFGESKITYSYYDEEDLRRIHDAKHTGDTLLDHRVSCRSIQISFIDGHEARYVPEQPKPYRVNYFIGNDAAKWAGNVPVYEKLRRTDLYDGIDAVYYSNGNRLKYDFIVTPGADVSRIQMQYNGQSGIRLMNEKLQLDLGFTTVEEIIPLAYQMRNGHKEMVRCRFGLKGNTVHFVFPDGYDPALELVIDPEIIASTYSGGTCISYGHSATYDEQGNMYAGGIAFGVGFPVTPGAYDVLFDSVFDISIVKFDPAGSNIIYATYLGGSDEENPHSLIVKNGELFLYGSCKSIDYPTTAGAFDGSFNGAHDIIVSRLSADGSQLLASTFAGGTYSDGRNQVLMFGIDAYRGEIIIADNGDVLIASFSLSPDFPVTTGAFSTTIAGGQDAVVFRMDGALTTMIWSTFIGSTLADAALGLRLNSLGETVVCGSTRGIPGNFPSTPGSAYPVYNGGSADAFVLKLNQNGSAIVASSYFGGDFQDGAYFVDLDSDDGVYICGKSGGDTPIMQDVYSVPGSSLFIAKFTPSLDALEFGTLIGDGTAITLLSPHAFMVDVCRRIYVSGFGGSQNYPVTENAFFPTWTFADCCYFLTLDENATSLLFASWYGGDHVDGGTSRFDPQGIVYNAVCRGGPGFPVTPTAYSDGSNGPAWDMCTFKVDFQQQGVEVNAPNVFTPNADGINDEFVVITSVPELYSIEIFDRWGARVFEETDFTVNWNGTCNGKECAEGVYYWIVRYAGCIGDPETQTGFVHLQRSQD